LIFPLSKPEVAEGVFRTIMLEPIMSPAFAEVLGIIVVLLTGLLIARWFLKRSRFPHTSSTLLAIGAVWVVLTILFEFMFSGLVMRMPMVDLLENYNLRTGHLFPLGLFVLLFIPFLSATLIRDSETQSAEQV
jgi:hypothetical protein